MYTLSLLYRFASRSVKCTSQGRPALSPTAGRCLNVMRLRVDPELGRFFSRNTIVIDDTKYEGLQFIT